MDSNQWFTTVLEAELDEINDIVMENDECLKWKQAPFMHTALSLVIKDRKENAY